MKRRNFIKSTGLAVPLIIGGMHIAKSSPIYSKLAAMVPESDRVLVIIQLNGGNDGLNTVIPLDQYSSLTRARGNIIIPETKVLKLRDDLGLNPSMTGLQNLYKDGKLCLLQNVGYPDANLSHFRSTDIWTSASDSDKYVNSGWIGRYIAMKHPDYPEGYPNTKNPDPLSISIGSTVSQTCQGPIYNMGMAVQNTANFYELKPAGFDTAPDSMAGIQLEYVRTLLGQTQVYTETIKGAASKGKNLSTKYSADNNLANQLKIVAQLISGGLKTKIYVCNIGGFDTHSDQVQDTGSEAGVHTNLLQSISSAVDAFSDDLKLLGIEDRVVGMTFSEFGRRIASNDSMGTDHGTAAPMFVFGTNVNPVIHGNNPIISSNVNTQDNLPYEIDFRSVYYSILKDWFDVSDSDLKTIMFKDFPYVQVIKKGGTNVEAIESKTLNLQISPNPVNQFAELSFNIKTAYTELSLFDNRGYKVAELMGRYLSEGQHNMTFDASDMASGSYYLQLRNGTFIKTIQLQVIR